MLGVCKLCLKQNKLRKSHLIPAAMYKYVRNANGNVTNRNPVLVTANATTTTSRQMCAYLLCAVCEDRFNRGGENWTLKQVYNGKQFPLADRLCLALQHYPLNNVLAFSGTAVGIDTNKLGYFALSVLWRAAVHQWDTLSNEQPTNLVNLGPLEEPIRQFLLGEIPLPSSIAVIATICTDSYSRGAFYPPVQATGLPVEAFMMLTLGIHFMIVTGPFPPIIRDLCCISSNPKLVFQRDCSQKTLESFAQIMNQRPVPIVGE